MIYRSPGLECPELTHLFPHVFSRPMPHSMGHDVPSDWADKADDDPQFGIYKRCGCWTADERQILFNVARQYPGRWLDIGSHTGITTAYMVVAGCGVNMLDPMYAVPEFKARAEENLKSLTSSVDCRFQVHRLLPVTSDAFFSDVTNYQDPHGALLGKMFLGVCIDGDHNAPCPMNDAMNAHRYVTADGVILFHDSWGEPVYSAARALIDLGYRARLYNTCHGLIACTRSLEFVFPEHIPDPRINWARMRDSMKGFPIERCE